MEIDYISDAVKQEIVEKTGYHYDVVVKVISVLHGIAEEENKEAKERELVRDLQTRLSPEEISAVRKLGI